MTQAAVCRPPCVWSPHPLSRLLVHGLSAAPPISNKVWRLRGGVGGAALSLQVAGGALGSGGWHTCTWGPLHALRIIREEARPGPVRLVLC